MSVARFGALICSEVAMWLAAPATDWRYVAWGANGAGENFAVALLEYVVGFLIVTLALRKIERQNHAVVALLLTLLIVASLEPLYWLFNDPEYRTVFRQLAGVGYAPFFLGGAILLLRMASKGTPEVREVNWKGVAAIAAISGACVLVLFVARQLAQGLVYYMLQSMIFTFAVVAVGLGASILAAAKWKNVSRTNCLGKM
ncbi:MAG: hypothetical protein JNM59_08235 [Hyphomonadaceae bacterium]|nr:hypothetical protein [Hyphomonadaceae bacterium]